VKDIPHYIQNGPSAFTLLELLVVIIIISIISLSIVPVYISSMNGIQMRNARNDLLSSIRYAQEMAVRESREYRIYFDQEKNAYRLVCLAGLDKDEKVFEPAVSLLGEEQQLPEFLAIERVDARKDKLTREHFISCLPSGASDKATIRLRDVRIRGSRFEVQVEGPLGKVTLKERR
jgi:prepilin-type N-terminal cleavage/methylation domain-containing protein